MGGIVLVVVVVSGDVAAGSVSMFAGGTDLMVQARLGAKALRPVLMNLGRIGELRGIDVEHAAALLACGIPALIRGVLDGRPE